MCVFCPMLLSFIIWLDYAFVVYLSCTHTYPCAFPTRINQHSSVILISHSYDFSNNNFLLLGLPLAINFLYPFDFYFRLISDVRFSVKILTSPWQK